MSTEVKIRLFDNPTPPNSTIFILGATGCGKTAVIANILLDRPRFTIIDVKDEYPPDFFADAIVSDKSQGNIIKQYIHALNTNKKRIILRVPPNVDDEDFIDKVCCILMDFQRLNKNLSHTLALDELNRFCTSQSCPQGLVEVIQRGRGINIQKVFGAQWFNQIPTWARDSFSEIYVFKHTEPRGLAMLESYGFDFREVTELEPHTVLRMRGGGIETVRLKGIRSK